MTEDFTTYIINDPNNKYTVTASRIDFVDLRWDDFDHYIYKDFGEGHFINFEWSFEIEITEMSGGMIFSPGLSNLIEDYIDQSDYISLSPHRAYYRILDKFSNAYDNSLVPLNVLRYVTLKRIESTLTAEIYNDKLKTDLFGTLSTPCSSTSFQYIIPVNSYGKTPMPIETKTVTGYIQNLDLSASPYPHPSFSHSGEPCI